MINPAASEFTHFSRRRGLHQPAGSAANLLEEILVGGAAALIELRALKDWRLANVRHVCDGRGN
jgi:hypothetical protein